ncbi:MAG: proprotein convertase P-domain-containing protein [Candidatus Eiseniibacteriota bacterium]
MPCSYRRTAIFHAGFMLVLAAVCAPTALAAAAATGSFHEDHRATPKLQFEPAWRTPAGASGEALARAFLVANHAGYELPAGLANLQLDHVRESLLGTHFTFRQDIGGIEVEGAGITVSIARADGRVYRVYNNTYPEKVDAGAGRTAALGREAAFDAAWNRLRAHGEVLSQPGARLAWVPEGADFRLTWIVDLPVSAPYGGWEVRVDAQTGAVLAVRDANLYRVNDDFTGLSPEQRNAGYSGPAADRRAAFARFEAKQSADRMRSAGLRASGTGVVFDPDPRTTLVSDALQDGSAPASFTGAYFTRSLLDITLNAGVYSLTGPWIDIINWDTPNTAPSTTTTGNWTAVRGNNAFNDAMTYFQIDQSQRYMQALGFTGATGIQEGPIGTDTDGFQGADNSFYQPASNRMSFGHGCVDDSEDADVMLHEYGHAINYSINPLWGGGDAGAMGEGFGDYWAGSYSWSTLNGSVHHPTWVFSWDGHGTGNLCWPGRVMDAFGAQYVHTTTYGAHQSIPGGFQSDELWSTPLFQTLLSLTGMSYPRSDVDRIILEAQFGLGSGIKMRDMANAIIATAGLLHPGDPHADEFIAKFLAHAIVNIPAVSLGVVEPVGLTSAGPNGAADPGETVDFQIDVKNNGTLGATAVSAVLSSTTPGVVVVQGASSYPDLGIGATGTNATDYSISLPVSHPCGDPVDVSLLVSYDDGAPKQTTLNLQMGTGVAQGASVSVSPALAIPDAVPAGVTSSLIVSGTGATVSANLNIDVNITHTWRGDLVVTLISPMGTNVILHNQTGGSTDDVIGNYPGTLAPAQPLSALIGQPLDGTWQLKVADVVAQDIGTLNMWGVNDISGYDCDDAATTIVVSDAVPEAFGLEAAVPSPFRADTAIRFAVPGSGAQISLEVFDIGGRRVRTLASGFHAAGTHSVSWNGENDAGTKVSSGIYFYRLETQDFSSTKKVVRVN